MQEIFWSPSSKAIHYFHSACQGYFFRPLSNELLFDMRTAHLACSLSLSRQDFRSLRQVDMDTDLRWKIADLDMCIQRVIVLMS